MEPTRLDLLRGMAIFGGIRPETLETILETATTAVLEPDDWFFREDERGESMFVLERGRVAVIKRRGDREFLLCELSRGDCFGEMSMMDLCPRSASVRALERCEVIELSRATLWAIFQRDLEQFTMIQMNMGRELSRRLRRSDEQILDMLSGHPGPAEGSIRAWA